MTHQEYLTRRAGVVLVVASAMVFSMAGIFTKAVSAEAWGVIFWRGAAAALFTFSYMALRGTLKEEIRAFNRPAVVLTLMMAAGSAAFIPAFKLGSVANVALIYGAAPFVAAALAWVFLRERPSRVVSIASLVGFGGVVMIVGGSVGGGQIAGDVLALVMTLFMAGVIVMYRRFPQCTAALPTALSCVLLMPVALIFGAPMQVPMAEIPVLIVFGAVFSLAAVTLSEGARRLPPAETALLSTLEMPLAPLLALLFLAEVPAQSTLLGGLVILSAVVWSQKPH